MEDYSIYITKDRKDLILKLINKGFPINRKFDIQTTKNVFVKDIGHFDLPTAEQVCSWLRYDENRVNDTRIFVDINTEVDNGIIFTYRISVYSDKGYEYIHGDTEYCKYEDALLDGIDKALDLI